MSLAGTVDVFGEINVSAQMFFFCVFGKKNVLCKKKDLVKKNFFGQKIFLVVHAHARTRACTHARTHARVSTCTYVFG